MRRLPLSLPIALLILVLLVLPLAVAADGTTGLPDGLTLTKGVPFIQPIEANKGQTVTIKVTATNNSTVQLDYSLPIKINGTAYGTPQAISLEPSASKEITFTVTAQNAGNNDVTVGNLQGFFTVKGGSFFDMFPLYVWIIFGVILLILVLLLALVLMKPKNKAGAQPKQFPQQGKQKGKAGKPGGPGSFQQPGGRPGMPDGMAPGMQGPGQFGAPYDMQAPGMAAMQQPFQQQPQPGMQPFQQQNAPGMAQPFPSQPGMPPPFQQQPQPGMNQQFPPPPGAPPFHQQSQQGGAQPLPPQDQQGMPPSAMRGPQYPQAPHMPQPGQQPPQQPPMHGMQPNMQQPQGHGMPPPPPNAFGAQPGMPFGMQPQAPQMPGQMYPPVHMPGQPPAPGGMPPPMPVNYQSMGMPKFSVSNLSITPNAVKVGEPVNISIYVTNNGMQTAKYSVVLRIGGVVENISDMTLSPGQNQTASFVVVKDAPGDYYADIDSLGGFFNVIPLNPPSFIVSNFAISPERVRQGQPVIITATVTNTGEITGSHPLILRVKGMAEAQQEVLLEPGKMQEVEFQVSKDTPGFYPVSMENWTGKFVVEMDWTG